MGKNDRFIVMQEQSSGFGGGVATKVILDKMTGVQYLSYITSSGAGLTILVDQEGKPLLYQPQVDENE